MKKIIILLISILSVIVISLSLFIAYAISYGSNVNKGNSTFFNNAELANTQTIEMKDIDKIDIVYNQDDILIYTSESDKVVLEEYMKRWDEGAFAKIVQTDGLLQIQSGNRNHSGLFNTNYSYVKLYIPESYNGELAIKSSSGSIAQYNEKLSLAELVLQTSSGSINFQNITSSGDITAQSNSGSINMGTISATGNFDSKTSSGSIHVKSLESATVNCNANSGSIGLSNIVASEIVIGCSSGSIQLESVVGKMSLSSSSGSIAVSGSGNGNFSSKSGSIFLDLNNVNGNITAEASSGNIKLNLPKNLEFHFNANTTSGGIITSFEDKLSYNKKGNLASGIIGENPIYKIIINTSSGGISVN